MSKKRDKKIVFETEKFITAERLEETKGEIINRQAKVDTTVYYENYMNPPIPEGYKHIDGEWNTGFVIERSCDGSQFVWIPVGSLDADGTLDGNLFTEKFGRRNYRGDEFSEVKFHEPLVGKLVLQIESVKKYGGFYISRYNISINKKTGKPQSVKGQKPWVNIDFNDAMDIAATIETTEAVISHLPFGAEYDSVQAWLIKSGAKTLKNIAEDSTDWGNHCNIENSPKVVLETGSCEEWCANNIYDFAGNLDEWTQEQKGCSNRVMRGGNFYDDGNEYPVSYRDYSSASSKYCVTGFRATLYIK